MAVEQLLEKSGRPHEAGRRGGAFEEVAKLGGVAPPRPEVLEKQSPRNPREMPQKTPRKSATHDPANLHGKGGNRP